MGLDMYLCAKRRNNDIEETVRELLPETEGFSFKYLAIEVAYWRKANQVHSWFVDNVQGGVDNCEEYWVHRKCLVDLLKACENANTHSENPEKYLPTRAGFFFGETKYDEWYFAQIEITIQQLTRALELPNTWEFYYSSSW